MKASIIGLSLLLAAVAVSGCDLNHAESHHVHDFVAAPVPDEPVDGDTVSDDDDERRREYQPSFWYQCGFGHRLPYPLPVPPKSPCPYDGALLRYIGFY